MPTDTAQDKSKETRHARRRSFWIHDEVYAEVCEYVSRHRNHPDDLTINQFVRDALEAKLARLARTKGGR